MPWITSPWAGNKLEQFAFSARGLSELAAQTVPELFQIRIINRRPLDAAQVFLDVLLGGRRGACQHLRPEPQPELPVLNPTPFGGPHSPALAEGREPTTVTRSRCPLALTLSTPKPLSSLKNVTRSINLGRLSVKPVGVFGCNHGLF
jgi:hypothetical protein